MPIGRWNDGNRIIPPIRSVRLPTPRAIYFRSWLASASWKPNFSLGAGYTIMKYSLDLQDNNFPGSFRLNVRGPEAFFKVSF